MERGIDRPGNTQRYRFVQRTRAHHEHAWTTCREKYYRESGEEEGDGSPPAAEISIADLFLLTWK
jgi:hypothetical protein